MLHTPYPKVRDTRYTDCAQGRDLTLNVTNPGYKTLGLVSRTEPGNQNRTRCAGGAEGCNDGQGSIRCRPNPLRQSGLGSQIRYLSQSKTGLV
jgi:hypothetical protein